MIKYRFLSFFIFFFLATNTYAQQEDINAKFLSSGNAFATMFFDYYYMVSGESDYSGRSQYSLNQKNDNSFSFRRIYFGYEHNFSEKFSAKIQLDGHDFSTPDNGMRYFFLKEANLVWRNIYPMADLVIGQTSTPTFSVGGSESFWRYRSIEPTIADIRGLRPSSDAGLRIKGLFNRKETSGYNIMAGNGSGTKPENDRYKVAYVNLWTRFLDNRLYIELFQDYNKASGGRSVSTTKGFMAWEDSRYTIGLELVHQLRSGFGFNNNDMSIAGLSFFVHSDLITNRVRVFGRYDSFDPDWNFSEDHYETTVPFEEQFFTFGFDYIPHKNIHVMPNIWVNSYKNKIGGQITPETEVVARLTFNIYFR